VATRFCAELPTCKNIRTKIRMLELVVFLSQVGRPRRWKVRVNPSLVTVQNVLFG
jgi:hypothetical protein